MSEKNLKKVLVIVGATASGKSALALSKAKEIGNAVIINADSMQVYSDLRILTAVPDEKEMQQADFALYGIFSGDTVCSAARWAELAADRIRQAFADNKLPIIVGGTGLYINSLINGLAPVPDIPPKIREKVRSMDFVDIRRQLEKCDAEIFSRFTDRHRSERALEVFLATNIPHSEWQKKPTVKLIEADWEKIFLNPPRSELYARCDDRFLQMLQQGAEDEVKALLAKNYPAYVPVMKALGVPEISAYLRQEISKEEMIIKAQTRTRNYAKRQITYFKNSFL